MAGTPQKNGVALKLITPVLVTLALVLLGWIKNDLGRLDKHFTNHLEHHQDLEVGYERRLSCVEKDIEGIKREVSLLYKQSP